MGYQFNADELFEIAVNIERNGAAFYRKAADQFGKGPAATLFRKLATAEVAHEKVFTELRSLLDDEDRAATVFDPNQESVAYLRAFADQHVFDTSIQPADVLSGDETPSDVLRMAIGLEKDSIVFYLGLKGAMTKKKNRDNLEAVIQEEMRHVAILSKELRRDDD